MIRILIADDHPIIRLGLAKTISREDDIVIAGEAKNAAEVISLLQSVTCDVLVLDISMPDRSGLDLLSQIRYEYPDIPVLILSMHPEEQYALQAFRSGASGYLTKQSAPEELVSAIRKVYSKGKYVSPELAEKLVTEIERPKKPSYQELSGRELQVLCMIASGKTPKTIAESLNISVRTVNTYRERILNKLQLRSNADIVRYAFENKLIE